MTPFVLIQLSSPFRWSAWDLPPVREALSVLAYARPVPALVCVVVAALFLAQALRHGRRARQERIRAGGSSRKAIWFQVSMALGYLLALAWIVLLGLELRYPEPQSPTQNPVPELRQ